MSRPVHFEDEAEAEYRQAVVWYESRRKGLGVEFFDEVDATIRQVLDFPRLGATVPSLPRDLPVRRLAVRRFPYHVVYMETAEELRILAVAHDSAPARLLARTIAVVRSIVSPTFAMSRGARGRRGADGSIVWLGALRAGHPPRSL